MSKDIICKACGVNQADYADKEINIGGRYLTFVYEADEKAWLHSDGAYTYKLVLDGPLWDFSYTDDDLWTDPLESGPCSTREMAINTVVDALNDSFKLLGHALGYEISE